jgi:hypothetical protein
MTLKSPNFNKKVFYLVLLALLGSTCLSSFSLWETNIFIKMYGSLLSLQAGFLIIYFGFYRQKKSKNI